MSSLRSGIFLYAALALSSAQAGLDCTGVECAELPGCIAEKLEDGACCSRCLQKGCACRGLAYYECLRAGFQWGTVPAGASIPSGSRGAFCRCPEEGGELACDSPLPCPPLPQNCARVHRPRGGCPRCVLLGCFSGGRLHPVGHSFQPEPCTLCHCLASGSFSCASDPGCEVRVHDGPVPSDQRQPAAEAAGDSKVTARADGEKKQAAPAQVAVSSERAGLPESLASCCTAGRRRASADGKCPRESAPPADSELCRELQELCCLSALDEARCRAGVEAAQSGDRCLRDETGGCGSDSFKSRAEEEGREDKGVCHQGRKMSVQGRTFLMTDVVFPGQTRCSQICSPFGHSHVCTCLPGYQLLTDGTSCEDVDECASEAHNCSGQDRCVNLEGSFRCVQRAGSCKDGFSMSQQGTCVDTNECASPYRPCPLGRSCYNTIGSYSCLRMPISCSVGYRANEDNARCVDVDECRDNSHHCHAEQVCRNVPGSYRCDCRPGYRADPVTWGCVDINECHRYQGRICAQLCVNTPGSYQCGCNVGFRLAPDGQTCADVDECQNSPCSHDCLNVLGSFECRCQRGFTLSPTDRTACLDIDECLLSSPSLCAYQCINTPGSFTCRCPDEGYVLSPNGRNCKDLDECKLGTHNCSADESCFNIQGTFKCLSFECPANYRRVGQTRCERMSCQDYVECQMVPRTITYYQLSLPTNVRVPADVFRMSPTPVRAGDNILLSITGGNEAMFFGTRRLNPYMGYVYLRLPPRQPQDFLLDVEMTLIRQAAATKFLARIYIFITAPLL
ncbi:fibulin-1-like isoform X2 [Hemitrygon akajei]|uniref:fibulin-1-like isoform X2 n=1 Tax=Hemitrygon akajei TaxID=2704970 RepID=UPI003BF943CB